MSSSSSDNSDGEERFENLRSAMIKSDRVFGQLDESYAYKHQLGDLIFDANFETGNLGSVNQIDRHEYELTCRPDVANPRHRMWFNFNVSNQACNQCVVFTFVNLSDTLALFHEGFGPVVRSQQQPNWTRLHSDQVFHYRSRSHKGRLVLSITFRFLSTNNQHQFALLYPYSVSRLQSFLAAWIVELKRFEAKQQQLRCKQKADSSERTRTATPQMMLMATRHSRSSMHCNISTESRAQSVMIESGRSSSVSRLSCLAISNRGTPTCTKSLCAPQSDPSVPKLEILELTTSVLSKPVNMVRISANSGGQASASVIVIGRVHSGNMESVSSYVCQGLIDFVLSRHRIAQAALRHIDFCIFPLADPDSVWSGNTRTDIFGQLGPVGRDVLAANPNVYTNYGSICKEIESIVSNSCGGSHGGSEQADRCGTPQGSTFKANRNRRTERRCVILELFVNYSLIGCRMLGLLYKDQFRMEQHLHLPRLMSRFSDGFYFENCQFKPKHQGSELYDQTRNPNVDQYCFELSPYAHYKRSLTGREYEQYDENKYLLVGKSLVYALLECLRPKASKLEPQVDSALNKFHPSATDVDDLTLQQQPSRDQQQQPKRS